MNLGFGTRTKARFGTGLAITCVAAGLTVAPAVAVEPHQDAQEANPQSAPVLPSGVLEYREAGAWQPIYRGPGSPLKIRGLMMARASFAVIAHVSGPNCKGGVWGELAEGGFTCLGTTKPTTDAPIDQPKLVPFDQPRPEEYFQYIQTGKYERDPVEESAPLLPFIYGKVWRRWRAPAWDNLRDWNKGLPPSHNLDPIPKYHFVEAIDTPRGTVLKRNDGVVVPADEVFIYPVDRFAGRDLIADPVPAGQRPAWVVNYDGVNIRTDPRHDAPVVATMPYHTALSVDATPVDGKGRWWRIPDAVFPGVDGWVPAGSKGVRVMQPLARPPELSSHELWVDVDTREQVLTLREGDRPVFATLVSTGEGAEWATPPGLYRVYDKTVYGDMKSREDAAEPYEVERVPWVMHFKTRYALHGVFWHWGFGHSASHGCVNLSPQDARTIFNRITPRLGKGWQTVYSTPADPGTHIRIHAGSPKVPDLRAPIK